MTEKRQKLIDRFQQWLDTNPSKGLIAAQCATIAEEYHLEESSKDSISEQLCSCGSTIICENCNEDI